MSSKASKSKADGDVGEVVRGVQPQEPVQREGPLEHEFVVVGEGIGVGSEMDDGGVAIVIVLQHGLVGIQNKAVRRRGGVRQRDRKARRYARQERLQSSLLVLPRRCVSGREEGPT